MAQREDPWIRRRKLLEAGTRLWATRSFDAISTQEIIEATGVSIGLVYHYFGSKRGFYLATVRAVAEELLDRTQLLEPETLIEALQSAIRAFLEHLTEHPGLYRATLRGGLGFDPEVQTIAEEVRWTLVDRIQARRSEDSRTRGDRRLLYGWLGFLEYIALDWAEHRDVDQETIENIALECLRRLLR